MPAELRPPAWAGDSDEYRYGIDADAYRRADHGWSAELDDLAVHAGPPFQRMGIRGVPEDRWFVIDGHAPAERALRVRLLDERRSEVSMSRPGTEAAQEEAHHLIAAWMAAHHHARPTPPATGTRTPLEAAALLVQDDLCLMARDAAGWRLVAGVLCFPTYWRLGDKLGDLHEVVHGPVPHYAEDLSARVSRFFDRLAPGRIAARRNWGISPHPLLFLPDGSLPPPPGRGAGIGGLWLRSERQTLRRLPATGAVLFAIRIQLAPLDALRTHPGLCGRLATALESWSPELALSRGGRFGHPVGDVVTWLRRAGS